jgi:hypothetical protein
VKRMGTPSAAPIRVTEEYRTMLRLFLCAFYENNLILKGLETWSVLNGRFLKNLQTLVLS